MVQVGSQSKGLARAKEIYQNRNERAKELKAMGKRIIGYFCCYPPVEFLTALDIVPYRILGDVNEPPTRAEAFMEIVTCGYIRSCFDIAAKGRYDFLDGVVSCRSCQGIEVSYNAWRYYFNPSYYHIIDVPHKMSPWGLDFVKKEYRVFKKDIEKYAGREISDQQLREAIKLHNENRALVRALYGLRQGEPPLITGSEVMQVMVATMSIPVEESIQLLREVTDEVKERKERPEKKAARLLVWGGIIDGTPLIELMEQCGAYVVMDDTCVGSRFYWPDVELTEDPLDGIAERYLDKIVCPRTFRDSPGTHAEDLENRFKYLRDYAADFKVNGVILEQVRYCDTHGWEIPDVMGYLREAGLPVLLIEHDYSAVALEPLRTRIEAFLEMAK